MKIVLALDLSPLSEAIVSEVLARPWPKGSLISIVHVLDITALTSSVGYLERFIEKETSAAQASLGSIRERFQAQELEAITAVIEGYPSTAIVDYAKQRDADFIIVGSHGQSGITRFFLGSVAKSVVRNAHCSVEVVRPNNRDQAAGTKGMKILLATDGSAHSEAAARSIIARPWPAGSEIRIISVVEVAIPVVEPWYVEPRVMEALREERVDEAQKAIAAAERLISAAGLNASTRIPIGMARTVILDEAKAWPANLIVVGSHGRRGVKRLLLGSVSETLALHAACSVEVIRGHSRLTDEPV